MTTVDAPGRLDQRPDHAPAPRPSPVRALVLRVHFFAGLLVGPFLLVAALTGFAYTLTPALEQVIYADVLHVPASDTVVPLSTQIRAGAAAVPGATFESLRPATTATDTTQVMFAVPGRPNASWARTAFVDPHTGTVHGVLDTYGSANALPLRTWVDQLHDNLHLGDVGRLYAELAASWLWVLVAGGLVLWLGRRRSLRRTVLPTTTGGRRSRLRSWHGAVGLWASAGLVFLAASGLTWSVYAGQHVTDLRGLLSWDKPSAVAMLPGAPPMTGAASAEHAAHLAGGASSPSPEAVNPASLDAIDRAGQAIARSGLGGPLEIEPATMAGAAIRVTGIGRGVHDLLDAISVDPATGAVVDTVRFADWPLMAKLAQWAIDAHMGLLFGAANQAVLAVLALGLACMIVWGYVLWWRRGAGRRGGSVPPRGALRALSPTAAAGVLAVTVAVALLLPVLGVSLLAFLALDVLLGLGRRARVVGGGVITPTATSSPRRPGS